MKTNSRRFAWTRRFAVLALLALLSAALVAAFAEAPQADRVVVFWHSMSEEAGALMDRFVSDYNAERGAASGVRVEAVFQGKYSDATAKLNALLSAEDWASLPDVMQIDATGKIAYATSGKAYTADQAMAADPGFDASQYLGAPWDTWNYGGAQLGVPFSASTTVLYYNKTLLDAAGAAVPEDGYTFAQIAALADVLPKETADGLPLSVIAAIPNTPSLGSWLGQLGSDLVDNRNGSEASATALACMDNGALVEFLTQWKLLYDSGALLSQDGGLNDLFAAGQLAMLPASSSNIASLTALIGGRFEMGVTLFPRVNDAAVVGASTSGAGLFLFDKGDEDAIAAGWDLVKYLTGAQVQSVFAEGTGYLPANKAALDEPGYQAFLAEHPQFAAAPAQLAATPGAMRSVTVGPSIDFYYAIQDGVSFMLEDGLTPEEGAQALAEELTALLEAYNRANP